MPKSSAAVDKLISQLAAIRANPSLPGAKEQIIAALESKVGYIVERAAAMAGELKISEATAVLVRAFDRLMASSDPSCAAKTAIANSLYEMGCETPEVFIAGVKHVQMEPAFGGSVDVAAGLRGVCALGLVRIAHRDAMLYVTDLLTDPQVQARIVAARARAYSGRDEAALLLRLKARLGDREPDVIAECLTAMMKLSPQKSIPFVAEFLDDSDEMIRESAALSLGESRRREAYEALRDQVEHTSKPDRRRALLLALAVCRLPEAMDYLVGQVEIADIKTATYAIDALKIYRNDQTLQKRIREAVERRGEPSLKQAAAELLS